MKLNVEIEDIYWQQAVLSRIFKEDRIEVVSDRYYKVINKIEEKGFTSYEIIKLRKLMGLSPYNTFSFTKDDNNNLVIQIYLDIDSRDTII